MNLQERPSRMLLMGDVIPYLAILLPIALAFFAGPVEATTWGAYEPYSRTITATEGGQTLTIQMPFPEDDQGTYDGFSGGKYVYETDTGEYRLELTVNGPSLLVTIDSEESLVNPWNEIRGPKALVNGDWRRVDVSQYGMPKGHDFSQKSTYLAQKDLWAWAFWRPDVSHGSLWDFNLAAYNANSGNGNPWLAPKMLYQENTAGLREPLHEQIEIRVDSSLWDTVPTFPASRISPWANQLANTVLLDSWSHDSAAELTHLLQTLQRIAGEDTNFFTIWATWGAGGHDAYTPDSLWINHDPPYLPNHTGFGSLERMRALGDVGDATGWMTFRTYYSHAIEQGPSYLADKVRKILNADGSEGAFSKLIDLPEIYERQEVEVRDYLGSSASFTDSLSTGYPSSHRDFDATVPNGLSTENVVTQERTMAEFLETTHGGPVTGEGLSIEDLLGTWVATGQFDMHNGSGRRMTPEYKLRRLHGLSTFHGMGQNYRFTDISQLWFANDFNRNGWRDQSLLDDYRATQLLFGNGGYVYAENQLEEAPWRHYLGEVLLVAPLQRYFALEPVSTIEYETSGQSPGSWHTLEELVEDHAFVMLTNFGRQPYPPYAPLPQSPEFDRIRVTYANGLQVVVNRGTSDFSIDADGQPLTLPPSGWAIWGSPNNGHSVLAYSAYAPSTTHRIDFLEDQGAGVRFVDPRGGAHFGVERPTQWVWKINSWRQRLEADLDSEFPSVTLEGQRVPLVPARMASDTSLDTDFTQGLDEWRTIRGAREATVTADGLELDLDAAYGFFHSGRLALPGDTGDRIEVDFRYDHPTSGIARFYLFFQRPGDVAFGGGRFLVAHTAITGGWQTLSFPVGDHASWAGSTITRLRFDPATGLPAAPAELTLGAVRWVPAP